VGPRSRADPFGPYLCQKPILEFCPTSLSWRNTEFEYSPIMEFERVTRSVLLPPSTLVNNPDYLEFLIGAGLLTDTTEEMINANVVQ